jgi:predicted permease
MLSRAAAHGQEIAVRLALGASRWRVARLMMTDGVLIAAAGAALGVAFADWASGALGALMTRDYAVPTVLDTSPDARVLAFASAAALVAGMLSSLVPALRMGRQDPALMLRQSARTLASTGRTGKALIVAQVALSLVLLMDAGLLVRTMQHLRTVDFGFETGRVMASALFPVPDGYTNYNVDQYYPQLADRIAGLPGVDSVGLSKHRLGTSNPRQRVAAAGAAAGDGVNADLGFVGPGFFETLRIPVLQGRAFAWDDNSRSRRVAVVSRSVAERLFAGDAIGRHIRIGDNPKRGDLEIVGVISDARVFDPRNADVASVFVPMLQEGAEIAQWADLLVRSTAADPTVGELKRAVESLGRESIAAYRPLARVTDRAILRERISAMIGGFFGALALLLAAIGLYGLMAYAVAQRQREIGIRMALGAARGTVVGMVVRETMMLVGVGLAIGIPAALAAGRLVGALLVGLSPTDPVTLAAIAALLAAIGLVAGLIPGRRAALENPAEALRS